MERKGTDSDISFVLLLIFLWAVVQWDQTKVPSDSQECSTFNEKLDNTDNQKHPSLGYETNRGISEMCLAVLISHQHLLAPVDCYESRHLEKTPVRHVLLGDWNPRNANSKPQLMQIDEIIIYPEYKTSTFTNNICILQLVQIMTPSDHIRPICLPPLDINANGQYFPINATVGHNLKGLVHVSTLSQMEQKQYNLLELAIDFYIDN